MRCQWYVDIEDASGEHLGNRRCTLFTPNNDLGYHQAYHRHTRTVSTATDLQEEDDLRQWLDDNLWNDTLEPGVYQGLSERLYRMETS